MVDLSVINWIEKNNDNSLELWSLFVIEKEKLQELAHEAAESGVINDENSIDMMEELKEDVMEYKDFLDEWRALIDEVLPDLDVVFVDACLDELKKLRLVYGFVRDAKKIKRFLKRTQRQFLDQKNDKDPNFKEKLFSEVFADIVLDEILWFTESNKKKIVLNDEEDFNLLVFLADHFDEMDEEKKKKFMMWFEDLLARYKEWKVLDVYEIQIAEDGTIIIRWKIGDENVVLYYHPDLWQFQVQIGEVRAEDLNEIVKDLKLLKPFVGSGKWIVNS